METLKSNWLTIPEAANYLRCGERFLRELVANKQIPHVVFAGKALFYPKHLDEWLLSQEKPAGDRDDGANLTYEIQALTEPARREVDLLITKLAEYKQGKEMFVNSFGRNLQTDLQGSDYRFLSIKVYAQLSRWCHPRRCGDREKWAGNIARKISTLLFGKVIDRISHPSYRS